jgi:dTDP-4-amino-4,6-dideoxygalactose transaminase
MTDIVPFLDVAASYRELRGELEAAVRTVLEGGSYILGREVGNFEHEFASYVDARRCVGTGTGLDAIELGLRALGVKAGDEVIVPSNTFIATWLAVNRVGGVPVPVEPNPSTYNLDPLKVEAALTHRTRVIIPVHLYGLPADMDPILAIAKRHGVAVLDDAAQAHGAMYHGRKVGGLADVSAWSFYPAKNLGAYGDAGAITTNDLDIADKVRVLRNYGSETKYVNKVKGTNSRLDEIQAAVLRVKLRHLDEWNERRKKIAKLYGESLPKDRVVLPVEPSCTNSSWHLYVVRSMQRDSLRDHLRAKGIETMIHYPIPPHLQSAYADMGKSTGSYPISEAIHREVLSLPIGPHLSEVQAMRVVEGIRSSTYGQ